MATALMASDRSCFVSVKTWIKRSFAMTVGMPREIANEARRSRVLILGLDWEGVQHFKPVLTCTGKSSVIILRRQTDFYQFHVGIQHVILSSVMYFVA